MIDFLSGKYSPVEACKLLEKRFFNLQCPTQDARAVLDAAIAATQSLKTQIAFQVELLKTGKEARRGLHYRDPILRRTVEITLDKLKNIAGSVDADKINLKLEPARSGTCQQQVISGS